MRRNLISAEPELCATSCEILCKQRCIPALSTHTADALCPAVTPLNSLILKGENVRNIDFEKTAIYHNVFYDFTKRPSQLYLWQ